jgi:hypothetical protein
MRRVRGMWLRCPADHYRHCSVHDHDDPGKPAIAWK